MSEIESCITSFVDGRVRLRHPSLKRAEDAEQVRGFLASLPGILRVTVNSRTGSLLLEYDPDQISREDLLALAGQWADIASAKMRRRHPGSGASTGPGPSGSRTGACWRRWARPSPSALPDGNAGMSWREGCSSSSTSPISIPIERLSSRPRRDLPLSGTLSWRRCSASRGHALRLHPGGRSAINGPSALSVNLKDSIQEAA